MNPSTIQKISEEAAILAKEWQNKANELLSPKENTFQSQMASLLKHPQDKTTLTGMIDQSFRSQNAARVSDQVEEILKDTHIPEFFTPFEQFEVKLFLSVGKYFPRIAVPAMINKMRNFSQQAIIPGESAVLSAHLKKRKKQDVRMNINHLGEAVLGEAEAASRMEEYLSDLKDPQVEYISIKISTIYSQIQTLAFKHSVKILKDRLSILYRAGRDNIFTRKGGETVPKFVNLDMEEYRDLEITIAAFTQTLDQPEFKDYSAGIVLQAYMPDSYNKQLELTEWAKKRVDNGGAPMKIRIVKGANLEMEQVDAAVNNWPLATYHNKLDVDANYKRMVVYGMTPENAKAVHLGIASHNLFELAFAYKMMEVNNLNKYISFEMLEGMADHVRRAISQQTGGVLLYAPVATKEQFINAIAYLIRRLDENTAPDNFLRYSGNLKTGSKEWTFLEKQYLDSCVQRDQLGTNVHRIQDRSTETFPEKMGTYYENEFKNEPDTDWSLSGNRKWAESIRTEWKKSAQDAPVEIPLVIGGVEIFENRTIKECLDPSQFDQQVCIARYNLGNVEDVQQAVEIAKADPDGWRAKSHQERHEILSKVAMELRKNRGNLIGAAASDTGKVFIESDVEVSEAIDFANYYPHTVKHISELSGVECCGKGVGIVISPWNFPIAIPCGGLVATLAAGNTVIFKPSSDAVLVAWQLCQSFWNAGISKNVLQFLPCPGSGVGSELVAHPDVDFVILTGGTETGLRMLDQKPQLLLAAETGGKNATIVTAMSDRDQAIKNIVNSAFGNCGQKCSATSLLVLEKEVYDDLNFRTQLVDAAKSTHVGSAWEFSSKIATLIKPPSGDLEKGLSTLEAGESWVLKPEMIDNNPHMWSPGIKWDVQPGSYTHMTEFFGPVLAVMKADNLDHAIELVNQTGYGLTSGIESLDLREQDKWLEKIEAGNLYINRGTTGAITLRQPFGGVKKSALGAGIKAGSPNYVTQFMKVQEISEPAVELIQDESQILRTIQDWNLKLNWGQFDDIKEDINKSIRAVKSYLYQMETEFSKSHDYFHLRGQDNIFKYKPLGTVLVRLHAEDTLFESIARIAATRITRNRLIVSLPEGLDNSVTQFLLGNEGKGLMQDIEVRVESDEQLILSISTLDRVRYANEDRVSEVVLKAVSKTGFYINRSPVLMEGRLELIQYLENQSICNSYHRYGNLGERAL